MTRHESPETLTRGSWQIHGLTQRWVPDEGTLPPRALPDQRLLVACPTCYASVGETCRAVGETGRRNRRPPHILRIAPRACICGQLLPPGHYRQQFCDTCRPEVHRQSKRDHMRRVRAAKREAA